MLATGDRVNMTALCIILAILLMFEIISREVYIFLKDESIISALKNLITYWER